MERATKEATRQAVLEYNKRVREYMESNTVNEKEQQELDALWDTIAPKLKPLKELK